MSYRPIRFVHAADFHLETPPFGVSEVPEHLHELFLESVYWAAERVFETVLAEEAAFLVLSGDVLNPQYTGPRGPLFLLEQFERLAERDIPVFWAGGRVDPPEVWPPSVRLPDNVHVFGRGMPEEHYVRQEQEVVARVLGASGVRGKRIRAEDYEAAPGGGFTVAVAYGRAEPNALKSRGIDYWALGGRHARRSLFTAPHIAHYPGTPQGRHPEESGAHGCTLVQIDPSGRARTTLVPTDVMRWHHERVVVDEAANGEDLQRLLRERMHSLTHLAGESDLLISWTVAGTGPVLSALRHGPLGAETLQWLREEYGHGPPAAWSGSLETEPHAVLPQSWYEQDTIRGDFLRAVQHLQANEAESLGLDRYLSEEQRAGELGTLVAISDRGRRQDVLREAMMLGVDLLTGEGPES